jgi:hypothetical protein
VFVWKAYMPIKRKEKDIPENKTADLLGLSKHKKIIVSEHVL